MVMRLAILLGLVLLVPGCNLASVGIVVTPSAPTATLEPTPTSLPTQTPEPAELPEVALTCDQIIREALARVGSFCDGTDRNEACYGSDQVSADLLPGAQATFEQVGDLTSLYNLRRITTASWDDGTQKWGLALLKAQVNLPSNLPGQNVTFLLYGGATLDGVTPRMDAVILNTSIGGTTCTDAPPSAALVQAPLGSVVSLNINGADLIIGSTLYITAEQAEDMSIGTIDGTVIVSAMGVSQTVGPGAQVRLPLGDENGLMVVGPPSPPEPFDLQFVELSPLQLLPEEVEIPEPIVPKPTSEASPTHTPTGTDTLTPTGTPTITRTPTRFPTLVNCVPRTDWAYRYTVVPGDTLSSIASRAGVSIVQLQAGNCLANANQIFAGQVLRVPVPVISTSTPTATDTATPTQTLTPTETATITPDPSPTDTPTWTPTSSPTATFTFTPTWTWTPTFTPTWTPTFTNTPITPVLSGCIPFCEGPGGPGVVVAQ